MTRMNRVHDGRHCVHTSHSVWLCFVAVLLYYILLQLAVWWILHIAMILWKIQFPIHARSFEVAHRMRYIHIVMIIAALIIPLVPVITAAADGGYGLTRFPPILCTAKSTKATFYSLIMPIILIMQCGITMLLLIFWIIHKVSGYVE